MQHEPTRLRSVFTDSGRFCGSLLATARGFATYNVRGERVGYHDYAELAVRQLRSLAAQST